jgi:tight adherence protein B
MHFFLQILFVGISVALSLSLLLDRAQRKRLVRLKNLVTGGAAETTVLPATPPPPSMDKFLPRALVRNLFQIGIQPTVRNVVFAVATIAMAVLIFGLLAGPEAAAGGTAALLLIGTGTLNILAGRRVAQMGTLIPGFLDRMRQLLTVGNSLPTAFARTAQAAQPALGQFFAPTLRRIHNGAGFCESIRQCSDDIDIYEMHLFATAVAANARFGGSLSQALNNLVIYLRRRAAIERELRSSTAQIRASAWVLGLLPMLVASAIVLQNRDYANWFLTHSQGKTLLIYCLLSQLIGAVLMRAVVKTKF